MKSPKKTTKPGKTAASPGAAASAPRRRTPQWALTEDKEVAQGSEERYHSRTIERALDALEAFDFSNAPCSLKEISTLTKQPESSLYRALTTLQKRGYLLQNRDGTYQLTRKVLYGHTLDVAERLRELARPILEELSRQFDETVNLSCVFTDYIQVLDAVETFQPIRVAHRAGRIIPPHCSSMGKAILAHLDNDTAGRMLETYGLNRRTEHTITDRQELRKELEEALRKGYAADKQESMLGCVCYGSPIFCNGTVIGALSVSTPLQRLTPKREEAIRAAVIEAAKRVSDVVGRNPAQRP